jgi:hypothetical protein
MASKNAFSVENKHYKVVDTRELERIISKGILKSFITTVDEFVIAGKHIEGKNVLIEINVDDTYNFPTSILYPVQLNNIPFWELIHSSIQLKLFNNYDEVWYRDWLFDIAEYISNQLNPSPTILWDYEKNEFKVGNVLYDRIKGMSSSELNLWAVLYGFTRMSFYYEFDAHTTYYYKLIQNAYVKQYLVIQEHINERLEHGARRIDIYFEDENFRNELLQKAEVHKKSRI